MASIRCVVRIHARPAGIQAIATNCCTELRTGARNSREGDRARSQGAHSQQEDRRASFSGC